MIEDRQTIDDRKYLVNDEWQRIDTGWGMLDGR